MILEVRKMRYSGRWMLIGEGGHLHGVGSESEMERLKEKLLLVCENDGEWK